MLPLLTFVPLANSAYTYTMTIEPLTERVLVFNLDQGDIFQGSLSISGGWGNDINFWVTDPQGHTVLNLGRVSGGTTFQFDASMSGGYTLHFDNTFSWFSSKIVTLSYNIETTIMPGVPAGITGIFIGLIIVVIVLITIIGYLVIRFRKKTEKQPVT
ncbi:MAG: emp24/gp25L/p24 family protein [Nitrososphaerales archaeon]